MTDLVQLIENQDLDGIRSYSEERINELKNNSIQSYGILRKALQTGVPKILNLILEKGINIECCSEFAVNLFPYAKDSINLEFIKSLLDSCPEPLPVNHIGIKQSLEERRDSLQIKNHVDEIDRYHRLENTSAAAYQEPKFDGLPDEMMRGILEKTPSVSLGNKSSNLAITQGKKRKLEKEDLEQEPITRQLVLMQEAEGSEEEKLSSVPMKEGASKERKPSSNFIPQESGLVQNVNQSKPIKGRSINGI